MSPIVLSKGDDLLLFYFFFKVDKLDGSWPFHHLKNVFFEVKVCESLTFNSKSFFSLRNLNQEQSNQALYLLYFHIPKFHYKECVN